MARLVVENGHQNNSCEDEVGLRAYNIDFILDSLMVIIKRVREREKDHLTLL